MTLFRYSILAATFAAAMGAAGAASAADKSEDPTARYCTNDPDLASDLYEYLQDCPAAQALLNRAGQWEAVERGAVTMSGATSDPGRPADVGRSGGMNPPDTSGPGGTVRTPNAPGDPSGTARTAPSAPGSSPNSPSAPGGAPMGAQGAPSGGGKAN